MWDTNLRPVHVEHTVPHRFEIKANKYVHVISYCIRKRIKDEISIGRKNGK